MTRRFLRLFTPAPLGESIKLYLSANALMRAAGIGRGIVLTWLMVNPVEFGLYQIGLLLANLLLPVLSLGSYESIARFVPEREAQGRLWRFLRVAVPCCLAAGLFLCGVLLVLAEPVSAVLLGRLAPPGPQASAETSRGLSHAQLVELVAVCVAVLILYHMVLAVLRGRRMFRAISMMELSAGLMFTVLAILAAVGGYGSGGVILAIYTASNLLTALFFGVPALWCAFRDRLPNAPPRGDDNMGQVFRFGFWAGWAAFFWQFLLLFPPLNLNRVCGGEVFATYRAMTILTQLGYIIPAAVGVAVASAVNARWESAGRDSSLSQLNIATKGVLAGVLLLCLAVAALRGVFSAVFPSDYQGGVDVVPLLLAFYYVGGGLGLITIRFGLIKRSALTCLSWVIGCAPALLYSIMALEGGDAAAALLVTGQANLAGVSAALATALLLLARRHLLPDRGTLLLIAAAGILLAPTPYIMCGGLAIVLLSLRTTLIFSDGERQALLVRAMQRFRS